jgi:hypothetical protein
MYQPHQWSFPMIMPAKLLFRQRQYSSQHTCFIWMSGCVSNMLRCPCTQFVHPQAAGKKRAREESSDDEEEGSEDGDSDDGAAAGSSSDEDDAAADSSDELDQPLPGELAVGALQ